jgi:hypothetical protein
MNTVSLFYKVLNGEIIKSSVKALFPASEVKDENPPKTLEPFVEEEFEKENSQSFFMKILNLIKSFFRK